MSRKLKKKIKHTTGFPSSHFFRNQFSNTIFFIYISKPVKNHLEKISDANITEDYQEYFRMEKVVVKKVTGENPGSFNFLND